MGKEVKVRRHQLTIEDDYTTPEGRSEAIKILDTIVDLATKYRESKGMPADHKLVPRGRKIDRDNWGLQYLINSMPAFGQWLDATPGSITIEAFYNPNTPTLPNGTPFDDGCRLLLANIADGIGLRARAKVLGDLMDKGIKPDEKWLSLACGGAMPCLKAADAAKYKPELTLVDFDAGNLWRAKERAKQIGLGPNTKLAWRDLTAKDGFEYPTRLKGALVSAVLKRRPIVLDRRLPLNHYDRAEATGFLEYLPKEKAVRFIKNSFKHIKPGGLFVTSNIRDTHPERAATEGVLQWPLIKFRSVEEVIDIVRAANVGVDIVNVYLPSDEVYAIYEMRKK